MDATGLILSHNKLEAEVYDLRDRIQDCTKHIKEVTSNQSAITDVYKSINSLKDSMKENLHNKTPNYCSGDYSSARELDMITHVSTHMPHGGSERDENFNSESENIALKNYNEIPPTSSEQEHKFDSNNKNMER